jgi:hypothetical protein
MALCCWLSSKGRQRSIYKKHQKQLRKKKNMYQKLATVAARLQMDYQAAAKKQQ